MMWPMWDFSGAGWIAGLGIVWMVLFWGAIIGLIIWGVKKFTASSGSGSKQTPLDIARERYARGEITKEEFEQIKKTLS